MAVYAHCCLVADVQKDWRRGLRTDASTHERPRFDTFEPRYETPQDVLDRLRQVERLDHDLQSIEASAEESRSILREALARNAYGTASIEGNPLSLTEVESLLAQGPSDQAMLVPDEREIINWNAFMETLPDAPPASIDDLLDLHARLFDGVMRDAGQWKDRPNYVGRRDGTVTFIPATPERVIPELEQALAWYHEAPEHPIVRAMVFFHEFEGIHPFRDGNGRAGRAVFTWMLHAAGYRGVRYALVDYSFNLDRARYYDALQRVEHDDYDFTSWLDYMSDVLLHTFSEAMVRFELGHDVPDMPTRTVRVAMWFRRLWHAEPARRVKFGDVQAAFPGINRRTLQEDLRRLVEAGILDKQGERKATTYDRPR